MKIAHWLRARTSNQMRWIAIAIGGVFAVAFLASDFFTIAGSAGVWTALGGASLSGPTLLRTCTGEFFNTPEGCNPGWQPAISIRLLAAIAIVLAGACLYRASQIRTRPPG
jgi:hypothetical protein